MHRTALVAAALAVLGSSAACPKASRGLKSSQNGIKTGVSFDNTLDEALDVFWIDFQGKAVHLGEIDPRTKDHHNTYTGHHFRLVTADDIVVLEHKVEQNDETVSVKACDEVIKRGKAQPQPLYPLERLEEFQGLVDKDPYTCTGESPRWSCLRVLSKETVNKRDKTKYGFTKDEARGERSEFDTIDASYTSHIPLIPKLSSGFLKMNMTDKMREALLGFWDTHHPRMEKHEEIGGDYSNIHKIGMSKLNLDKYQHVRREVVSEMQEVLQWWTQRRLKHTSTFGIRIYHRDSMLINHVDRADTHLASAVLQVAQDGVDEGWPLEVILDDGNTIEVYLQPGEMVLYEGARLFHGRPMRFAGDNFANVFSHFSPSHWTQVGKPWTDPITEEQLRLQPSHSTDFYEQARLEEQARSSKFKDEL